MLKTIGELWAQYGQLVVGVMMLGFALDGVINEYATWVVVGNACFGALFVYSWVRHRHR